MKSPQPTLLYDADCPLCLGAVDRLRRRGLLEGVSTVPTVEAATLGLPVDQVESTRSELLFLEAAGGPASQGFDAILRLLEIQGRWRWGTRLGRLPGVRMLGRLAYRIVAYNRRALSPPNTGGAACACDPPHRPGWRFALNLLLAAFVLGIAWLLGAAFARAGGASLTSWPGGELAAVQGSGVFLGGLLAGFAPGRRLLSPSPRLVLLEQALVSCAASSLLLVPVILVLPLLAAARPGPSALPCALALGLLGMGTRQGLSARWRHRHLRAGRVAPWLQAVGWALPWTAWLVAASV